MAPTALEQENHTRDAEFNRVLHGKSSQAQGGFAAMLGGKDAAAQKAAVEEYFKHWDNKDAADETDDIRAVWIAWIVQLVYMWSNDFDRLAVPSMPP